MGNDPLGTLCRAIIAIIKWSDTAKESRTTKQQQSEVVNAAVRRSGLVKSECMRKALLSAAGTDNSVSS